MTSGSRLENRTSILYLPIPGSILKRAAHTISFWSACRNRPRDRQTASTRGSFSNNVPRNLNPGEFWASGSARLKICGRMPLTGRNTSIYNALQSVFPEALFLPGTTNVVTASLAPLPRTPEVMSRRLQDTKNSDKINFTELHQISFYKRQIFQNQRFTQE